MLNSLITPFLGRTPTGSPEVFCSDCGRETDAAEIIHGREICPACLPNYRQCCECPQKVHVADYVHGRCDPCFRRTFTSCALCRAATRLTEAVTADDGRKYCRNCIDTRFERCESCSEPTRSKLRHPADGRIQCLDCFSERLVPATLLCAWDGPTTEIGSELRYGIEIETDRALDPDATAGGWGYCRDGSLDAKHGWEFQSPVLHGDAGLDMIREFFTRTTEDALGDSCGFHLHVELGGLDLDARKSVAIAYLKTEKAWASLVPDARASQEDVCPPLIYSVGNILELQDEDGWRSFCNAMNENRAWFNLGAYALHATAEVRLHQGTLSGRKVVNWVKAHLRFTSYAAAAGIELVQRFNGFDDMALAWNDPALETYYRRRMEWHGHAESR